jgi:uncharacterized protein
MNKVVLAVLLAGFGSQLIKLIVYWFDHKSLSLRDLIVTGGMPSSHAAFVISLATIIFLEDGVGTAFAIALVIAFIVVRDSFGVRRSVGEEGLLLTEMAKKLKMKKKPHFALGHTPLQVFVGSVLGFVVSLVVHYV